MLLVHSPTALHMCCTAGCIAEILQVITLHAYNCNQVACMHMFLCMKRIQQKLSFPLVCVSNPSACKFLDLICAMKAVI